MNALYSTPSIYTDAKNAANQQWPLKIDDYFPYGSTCFVNEVAYTLIYAYVQTKD